MKKLLVALLCLCLLLSTTAYARVLGTYPVTQEPITLTAYGFIQGSSVHESFADNSAMQELEKITGVHIEWECDTQSGREEKRALRIASGNLPDLFFCAYLTAEETASLASTGQLIDLAPMVDEYAPNLTALMEREKTIRVAITDDEGHIYSTPKVTTFVETGHTIINARWLENLGLAMPTTIDEFYDTLVAFKEQDANGNGDANDEIPLSLKGVGHLNVLMQSFGVYPRTSYGMFVYPGTDYVQNSYIADEMKDALIFCKKLYDEGLLDPETFVQDTDTFQAKGNADTLGCLFVNGAFVDVGNDLHFDYAGLPIFPDKNGNAYNNSRSSCEGRCFAITSNCQYPKEALAMVDYLYSEEGTILTWLGVEGKTWEWTDDTHTRWDWILPDDLTVTQLRGSETIQSGDYPSAHPVWFESDMWAKQANEIEASLDTDRFRMPMTRCDVMLWPNVVWTLEESEEMAFFLPDCKTYYESSVADFVTGVRDIEAEWDSYVATMKSMNIEEGIEMYQKAYEKYMAKMNG